MTRNIASDHVLMQTVITLNSADKITSLSYAAVLEMAE